MAKAKVASKPSTVPPNGLPVGGLRKTTAVVGFNGMLQYQSNNITSALPGEVIEFSYLPAVSSLYRVSEFNLMAKEPLRCPIFICRSMSSIER